MFSGYPLRRVRLADHAGRLAALLDVATGSRGAALGEHHQCPQREAHRSRFARAAVGGSMTGAQNPAPARTASSTKGTSETEREPQLQERSEPRAGNRSRTA